MMVEIPSELEAALRKEAEAKGVTVDSLVREVMIQHSRRNVGMPRPRLTPFRDRSAEMEWSRHPDPRFYGQWVALEGDQVVAAGANAPLVYKQAKARGIAVPFMTFASPPSDEPFVGGWID